MTLLQSVSGVDGPGLSKGPREDLGRLFEAGGRESAGTRANAQGRSPATKSWICAGAGLI